ncbi:hypothetical protein, variant [Aphanomyces invadans]|uniref:RecQ-mediated genome instability protein 1 n=1 Tax=Aphanomyces invadans TaxID=157072 RepID=A0A024TED5_9STRA|nr:hypothetical protein, variant [Aphanomyces invadans]ETV92520.1 hypothetical protein, variant [Aphanomyces invadans]|eukprot:XP_008878827.1 hypothetical protein, variant [Aphanomyces invadans]
MAQFLFADIETSCEPSLPPDLANMHRVVLQGRYFLQIVDISNVAAGHEQRQEDSPNRMLKLCLTDGASLAYAIEHKPIRQLSAKTPRGTKIVIENVAVRHGLLMLTSAVVLGASGNDALEGTPSATSLLPSEHDRAAAPPLPPPPPSAAAAIVNPLPPVTMPTPTPDKPWDADLSDEERSTDPSIRHLFYEPPRLATSSARPRATSSAPSSTSSLKAAADPMTPFTYLSTVNVASASRVIVKGFVKSVVSFQFQTGVYQLKVYVEDATRAVLVDVDPVFVQQLMGVPCATFVHAMQANTPQGMQWVATMQHKLSVLEGRLTIDFTSAACQPTLVSSEDATIATTQALLARLQATA